MKKILTGIITLLVLVLLVALAKDPLVKVAVRKGVGVATGLKLDISSINVGLARTYVDIKGLKLFNPPEYEDRVMIDMPEIYVDYVLPAVLRGKIHLREARIDLREFVVIRNARGELNLNALKVVKDREKETVPVEKKKADLQIDLLELKVGKVVYKDYSMGRAPVVQEFNINLNETFRDINDPDKLVSVIVVRALSKTPISRLTGFDIRSLEGTISGVLSTARDIAGKAQEAVVGVGGTAVQKAAEQVQNIFGIPFGSGDE